MLSFLTVIGAVVGAILGAILNRGRGGGFNPKWKGFNGTLATVLIATVVGLVTMDLWLGVAFGVAYFIGESFGWTKWITCIPGVMTQEQYNVTWLGNINPRTDRDLSSWVADRLVKESKNYLAYCFVGMSVRGTMWWAPVFGVLVWFGAVSFAAALISVAILSLLFPASYWFAYRQVSNPTEYIPGAEILYGLIYGAVLGIVLLMTP